MSKEFDISGEIKSIQTSDKTLSFEPNLKVAEERCFRELVTGKVKVALFDFSKGRGENGVYVTFNLDLPDTRYLLARARLFHMPDPFSREKVHGNYPETEGPYKGYCRVQKITISRQDTFVSNGETVKMRMPWQIVIENGYAKAKSKGQVFYEDTSTYKKAGEVKLRLTDSDFLDRMESINAYVEQFRSMSANETLRDREKKLREYKERNTYTGKKPQTERPQAEQSQTGQSQTEPSQKGSSQKDSSGNTAPSKPKKAPKHYAMPIRIKSKFQAFRNYSVATCEINGKDVVVYFNPKDSSWTKLNVGEAVTADLVVQNEKVYYCGAAPT